MLGVDIDARIFPSNDQIKSQSPGFRVPEPVFFSVTSIDREPSLSVLIWFEIATSKTIGINENCSVATLPCQFTGSTNISTWPEYSDEVGRDTFCRPGIMLRVRYGDID
tara:strand:+ start:603 stop:929 length:327 start_codon:yes stop_codon:yes gene_type:complete